MLQRAAGAGLLLVLACASPGAGDFSCPTGTEAGSSRGGGSWERFCLDAQDRRQGPYQAWDADSGTRLHGSYRDGMRQGSWLYSSEDGSPLAEETFREDRVHGVLRGWHDNGALAYEGSAVDGEVRGRWTRWYREGGKLSETSFQGERLIGRFVSFHPGGAKHYEGHYSAEGLEQGVWRRWWPDGTLRSEWTMDRGRHHGVVRVWYPDGSPKIEGERLEGRAHGPWRRWNAQGESLPLLLYDHGRELSTTPPASAD